MSYGRAVGRDTLNGCSAPGPRDVGHVEDLVDELLAEPLREASPLSCAVEDRTGGAALAVAVHADCRRGRGPTTERIGVLVRVGVPARRSIRARLGKAGVVAAAAGGRGGVHWPVVALRRRRRLGVAGLAEQRRLRVGDVARSCTGAVEALDDVRIGAIPRPGGSSAPCRPCPPTRRRPGRSSPGCGTSTQYSLLRRGPPCWSKRTWQSAQFFVSAMSLLAVTAPPAGTKSLKGLSGASSLAAARQVDRDARRDA